MAGDVRFAALGDSITVGLGDGFSMGHRAPEPAGRGFASLLAASLAPSDRLSFVNLAVTGATSRDIRTVQLPAAVTFRPQVASLVAGMNDLLAPRFDAGRTRDELAVCARTLRAEGAVVLMARFHDPGKVLRVPPPLRGVLRRRVAALNAAVTDVACGEGALVLDLGTHPEVYLRSSWDVDRVHPGPRGHRLLARGFAELLQDAGFPAYQLPDVGADTHVPGALAHAVWLATAGLPWLLAKRASIVSGILGSPPG